MTATLSPDTLYSWLQDDDELALIDVRDEGVFGGDGHLLFAVCMPLSRLELDIAEKAPRRSVRMVLCDGGDGQATLAAEKIADWGYTDIAILEGGAPAWEASGRVVFRGVNVPSKAFGEFVEHRSHTPSVSAGELKAMIDGSDNIVVLDSRPWGEYQRMSIPTGIDCPGAELAYRVHDIVDDPGRMVIVNCAGRTRSIIGAQSLINAGIPNRVAALRNGTMGWALAGFDLENGSDRNFPEITGPGLARARAVAARVADRFGIRTISRQTLDQWRGETDTRSLYLLDVRNPDEYRAGHVPGSVSAPGGQLVQATDRWVATLRSRLVLIDDTGVRATMTASWLVQMGWPEVRVLEGGLDGDGLESGIPAPVIPGNQGAEIASITADALNAMLKTGEAIVVDFSTSLDYKAGHIPGAWWAVRSRLETSLGKIPGDGALVFTARDPALARLAAGDAADLGTRKVLILEGGTAAWGETLVTGFENMADTNNDVQYKAYDHDDNIAFHMQEYLSWETGLVEQVERDRTARFRHFANR